MIEKLLEIPSLTSSKQKIEILKNISKKYKDDEAFRKYIIYTYDKSYIFNVRVSKKEKDKILSELKNGGLNLSKVIQAIEIILNNVKSKKTWKEFIPYIKNNLSKEEATLLFLTIDKNIGIGYKQIVKEIKPILFQKNNSDRIILPYFPFALADKPEKLSKIKSDYVIAQPKYDGFRAVITPDGKIYTRNHEIIDVKERPYLKSLAEEVEKLYDAMDDFLSSFGGLFTNLYLFDGEIFFQSFEDTMSLASREEEKDDKPLKLYGNKLTFYIFDYVDRYKFENYDFSTDNINDADQETRIEALREDVQRYIDSIGIKQIKVVPSLRIKKTEEEINRVTSNFVNAGYEGSIIKDPDKPYIADRKQQWIKAKPIKEIEVLIEDVLEGDGKYVGQAGKIVVKLPNNKIALVGSGISDDLRKDLWNNKERYIGKIAEVQYQEISKDGVLRFPRLLRIREDKSVDNWNKEM